MAKVVVGGLLVRDTLANLPPIPAAIWIGGALAIVGLRSIRVLRFRFRLRRAGPAPAEVERMVRHAAKRIGLTNLPQILMIPDRISP